MAKDLQVQEWLKRAADDEKSLRAILKDEEGSPSTACFLAQQMTEKFLKVYLISREKWYPKIHSLDALWEFCFELDHDFEEIKLDCIFLTSFYSSTRYPGDYPEFSFRQSRDAFQKALIIKDFVLKRLHR